MTSHRIHDPSPREMSEMSKILLEASRVATEKMLGYSKRMAHRSDAADDAGPGNADEEKEDELTAADDSPIIPPPP